MGEPHLHPEGSADERKRVVDVVAVTDERDDGALEAAEVLADREDVGKGLTRVLAQGQPVDNGDRCLGRELQDDLVRTGARHDRVDESFEVTGDVAHGLTCTHDGVLREVDGRAAELGHPGLERHAGSQARLLEQHRQRSAGLQGQLVPAACPELGLQQGRCLEDPIDLGRRQIRRAEQIPPDQRRGRRRHERSIVVGTGRVSPGRSGQGTGEPESERTSRCVSERAQSGNAGMDGRG